MYSAEDNHTESFSGRLVGSPHGGWSVEERVGGQSTVVVSRLPGDVVNALYSATRVPAEQLHHAPVVARRNTATRDLHLDTLRLNF